jgi:uncharacterized protein (DUF2062 family)
MPKRLLKRYLPTASSVRANPALRPIAHLLQRSDIFHLNRRSTAGAVFIGLFCAFLPLPMQMVVAGLLALAARCNLPLAVALVWVSNPITIPPMFYFAYRLGAWLLGIELEAEQIELNFSWFFANLGTIGYPLLFGSLVCGWVSGVTGFIVVRVLWRFHAIRRWRERRERRRRGKNPIASRKTNGATQPPD